LPTQGTADGQSALLTFRCARRPARSGHAHLGASASGTTDLGVRRRRSLHSLKNRRGASSPEQGIPDYSSGVQVVLVAGGLLGEVEHPRFGRPMASGITIAETPGKSRPSLSRSASSDLDTVVHVRHLATRRSGRNLAPSIAARLEITMQLASQSDHDRLGARHVGIEHCRTCTRNRERLNSGSRRSSRLSARGRILRAKLRCSWACRFQRFRVVSALFASAGMESGRSGQALVGLIRLCRFREMAKLKRWSWIWRRTQVCRRS